ncbi:MAG: hypothetical protein ABSG34_08450, partial [Candidatus Sulfotelmatobacter sp.]
LRALQETTTNAAKLGYSGYALEAQLALGEVELASGNRTAGRNRLTEVRKQAQQKGFGLIANRAARALTKSSETK